MAKIMVVEDNPGIGMVLQIALSDEGHQVDLHKRADEGLSIMQSGSIPDLVLTDLNMSGMNGRDLIKKMRNDQHLRSIPAVIITGSIPSPEILPKEHEFQGLLLKPFDIQDVVSTVAKLVS